jgi:hypothetical protein
LHPLPDILQPPQAGQGADFRLHLIAVFVNVAFPLNIHERVPVRQIIVDDVGPGTGDPLINGGPIGQESNKPALTGEKI